MSEELLNQETPIETEVVETTEAAVETTEVETTESQDTEQTEVKGRDAAEAAFDKVLKGDEEEKKDPQQEEAKQAHQPKDPTTQNLDPERKGPNSWKATVREKFRALPEDVQAEVLRREQEHIKLMNETTNARRFADEFITAYAPYEAYLRSQNVHPIHAFKDLLNTAYTLKQGDSVSKATMVANIIKHNGVDIETLDKVLSGQQQTNPQEDALRRELSELRNVVNGQQTQQRQAVETQIEQEISTFAANPANEFFTDVVSDMQILLNNGKASTLKDAYDMACYMNPEVRQVIQQRQTSTPTTPVQRVAPQVDVQTKVAASSSVKGAPSSTKPKPAPQMNGRDAALAAWEMLEKKTKA